MTSTTKWFAAALTASVLLATASPAQAQQALPCGDRNDLLVALDTRFDEHPIAMGLDQKGRVVEVLSSADGDTWTVLITVPGGLTCMVASGYAWENLPIPIDGPAV